MPEQQRRRAALLGVRKIINDGIEAAANDRDSSGTSNPVEARSAIRRFKVSAFLETTGIVERFSTETLEYLISQISEVRDHRDWLHETVVQSPKWVSAIGERAEMMIRDCVFLRYLEGMYCGAPEAYTLLEIYPIMNIEIGKIHLVTDKEILETVGAIFCVVQRSRGIAQGQAMQKINGSGFRGAQMGAVRASTQRFIDKETHLTQEIAAHLTSRPEDSYRLIEYMNNRQEALPSVNFAHFEETVKVQPSISSGVL